MKFLPSSRPPADPASAPATAGRRGLVIGAGVAGVAAVAAGTLHRASVEAPTPGHAKAAAVEGEGYRVSEHVRRYYETTKA